MSKRSSINDTQKANGIALSPRNDRQRAYMLALRTSPQTIALGPAGTGKTFIAAMTAANLYLRQQIDKIIITRPRVEVDEEWGALPGSLQRKTAPWAYPITEVLEEAMGKARYQQAEKDNQIEVVPLAFMRGRTLDNAFCILDEAQNTTVRQMKMFVTRIGENATVLINGDIAQKDVRADSGLAWALRMIQSYDNLPAQLIEFGVEDVERSAECRAWVAAIMDDEKNVA